MKLQNKKGFTLIELLVVITIIGILATGAVATYTSQIQKARDTTRINDLKSVESAVQQSYGDAGIYPTTVNSGSLSSYIGRIPQDSKKGEPGAFVGSDTGLGWNTLQYGYFAGDVGGVSLQRFELSTAFENKGNLDKKAVDSIDFGNEGNRLEIGIPNTTGLLDGTTSTGNYIEN